MTSLKQQLDRLYQHIAHRLQAEVQDYQQRIYNNMENLYKYIRKGDVVLVEGRTKLSRIIQLFSNSNWSHIGMYVGDELIQPHRPYREQFLEKFGDNANHLLIEAYAGDGVIAVPLQKYQNYNIRVCRPYNILEEDLKQVVEEVISNLGKRYDKQNIVDIALMLLPRWLNPFKKRSVKACLGSCNEFQVICSGMIARAFQHVGYPVLPVLTTTPDKSNPLKLNPYGGILSMRHYSQILPRDFDLSPNFQIIKFNIIETGEFDYKKLKWED
ncbi:MAG: hypothetical protein D6748_00890 [Calditrichaeota bacterium]|nr:MAG: hypothetical protein D6748_00890 [Calditrichota bacterium]